MLGEPQGGLGEEEKEEEGEGQPQGNWVCRGGHVCTHVPRQASESMAASWGH